jgi:hypothetical protein
MANPRRPGAAGSANTSTTGTLPIPPMDPEMVREIQMLAEAVLQSFTAAPNPLEPFGHSTVAWNITMPTTVIPGVLIEIHLVGIGDQVVIPNGSRPVAPYDGTTFALSLRTPLAVRQLGTLDLAVDFGACQSIPGFEGNFTAIVRGQANDAFPDGGQVHRRGIGATIDLGFNSFVTDIPLTVSVPHWFDPDVNVSLGFSVSSQNGAVQVAHDLAETDVSFGAASSALSAGCSALVATAIEQVTNGLLGGFIGPVLAQNLRDGINADINYHLDLLNKSVPPPTVPYKFYDLSLTIDGLNYRFCPAHAAGHGSNHPPSGGGRTARRSTNRR